MCSCSKYVLCSDIGKILNEAVCTWAILIPILLSYGTCCMLLIYYLFSYHNSSVFFRVKQNLFSVEEYA